MALNASSANLASFFQFVYLTDEVRFILSFGLFERNFVFLFGGAVELIHARDRHIERVVATRSVELHHKFRCFNLESLPPKNNFFGFFDQLVGFVHFQELFEFFTLRGQVFLRILEAIVSNINVERSVGAVVIGVILLESLASEFGFRKAHFQ